MKKFLVMYVYQRNIGGAWRSGFVKVDAENKATAFVYAMIQIPDYEDFDIREIVEITPDIKEMIRNAWLDTQDEYFAKRKTFADIDEKRAARRISSTLCKLYNTLSL